MYYLARRKLGMSPTEWDELPWQHERMYIEGFGEEGFLELSGNEFDAPGIVQDETPSFGPDPLEKAMAGAKRRRSTKLTD